MATPTVEPPPTHQLYNKESEWNNLHGHRAKTPIVSAIVSSAGVISIWTLIFVAWLWKQYKKRIRAKRRAAKGLPPKIKKPKNPMPTFIVPPDPAVIIGQHEPGERIVPRKHNSMDNSNNKDKNGAAASIELNERSAPINELRAHDEMIARQVFSKRSSLDPPKHEKRGHPSRRSTSGPSE